MGFPLGDWQFWSVTVCAAGAVWLLIKPFVGGAKGSPAPGACESCPKNARLPVEGKSDRGDGLVTLGKAR